MSLILKYGFTLIAIMNLHFYSHAQNYIGMHKDQIIELMKENQQNCKLNTDVVNTHYNYLKFEDKISEITILYFLADNDKCTMIRKMCDYSNINDVLTELNSTYKSTGKNTWEYKDEGKTYSVILSEEDWFFTVTTRLKD